MADGDNKVDSSQEFLGSQDWTLSQVRNLKIMYICTCFYVQNVFLAFRFRVITYDPCPCTVCTFPGTKQIEFD